MLLYSANENIANKTDEYSTLKPETNSASASGKSKGVLFVSARSNTKKINAEGAHGKTFQTAKLCAVFSAAKLKPPASITGGNAASRNITS